MTGPSNNNLLSPLQPTSYNCTRATTPRAKKSTQKIKTSDQTTASE